MHPRPFSVESVEGIFARAPFLVDRNTNKPTAPNCRNSNFTFHVFRTQARLAPVKFVQFNLETALPAGCVDTNKVLSPFLSRSLKSGGVDECFLSVPSPAGVFGELDVGPLTGR